MSFLCGGAQMWWVQAMGCADKVGSNHVHFSSRSVLASPVDGRNVDGYDVDSCNGR